MWKGSSEWKAKEWHHIAVSWDNKKEVNMYVDGKLVASGQASWDFKKQYETFSVGGQGGVLTTNGVIDELVLYDYVISDKYVEERFNAVRPLKDKTAVEAVNKLSTTM